MDHILLADDEQDIRDELARLLRAQGYEVTAVGDAAEALARAARQPFTLLIAAVHPHDDDGLDVVRRFKEMQPDGQAIVVAGKASLDTALQALRAGAYDYLIKPFGDPGIVLTVVDRALEQARLVKTNDQLLAQLQERNEVLRQANELLRELAVKDGLTGLFNHRYLHEMLGREVARCERHQHPFSLLMIDVDHFKFYNDAHGHPRGDRLLQELAELIGQRLRRPDVPARYGGEEFMLLLPETDRAGALHVAEAIRREVERRAFAGAVTQPGGNVTVSVGVACYPDDGATPSELLETVAKCLSDAKRQGRNRTCMRANAA